MFGSHLRTHEGVEGVSFAVWAPHARAVRIVGDFNSWVGAGHAMRRLDDNGVWELFVPELGPGGAYKFELLTSNDGWVVRADPMARYTEVPPATGIPDRALAARLAGRRMDVAARGERPAQLAR